MTTQTIVEDLRVFVAREFLNGKDEGLDGATKLLEWGIIDSVALVSLLAFIKDQYGLQVPNAELRPANIGDLKSIATMIQRLQCH